MSALTEDKITTARVRLFNYNPIDDTDKTTLILSALLLHCYGYWVSTNSIHNIHAPSEGGQENVATDILSAVNDAAIKALANLYLCGLLAPIRAGGGENSIIGEHPSRSSFEGNVEEISGLIKIDVAERDQSVLKGIVLTRDNNRCILTKTLDVEVVCDLESSGVVVSEEDHRKSGCTIAAHILPFSLAPNLVKFADIQRSSKVFALIEWFSGFKIVDRLHGIDINRIDNVVTLTLGAHGLFGALRIWLEAILAHLTVNQGRPHVYILKNPWGIDSGALVDGAEVTLTTIDPRLPVANPDFLAIHAACVKIYHASGMSEVIDQVLHDKREVKELSEDGLGPSFRVLEYSLVLFAS
ncbi:uncharacterized protein EV420DRAFT_1750104 [Desarmillaria tabescens]|uniref:HNH nuclease domain-containing protein n=1 Tax=Armillaria tabescens TaxID=1929756 RepID=A0AA39MYX9_ARMTA|nr:uncharacterized protein EV420DRAFT_1750104 [Desarmillaria tabescens]KAK0451338.1 hypothetical protein EV420DRAFT_1750104 [Desarmillaria tabescens]